MPSSQGPAAAWFRFVLAAFGSHLAAQERAPSDPPNLIVPAFTGYAHPDPDAMQRRPDGSVPHCRGELVFHFDLANKGMLAIELERTANAPAQRLRATLETDPPREPGPRTEIDAAADQRLVDLGRFGATAPGPHRLTLATTDGTPLTHLARLLLRGEASVGLRANTAERRNAASVHLGYPVPKDARDDVEWFYVEVTPRTDPVWTYYMATGWHRGYFGMQVNSATERRVIFSVWDAGGEAKDRGKVGADDRVTLVAKGENVQAGDFGNEGTGGHSHLVHDWRLGDTFRFLLHARPDGDATIYSGWFWFEEQQQWRLIASFRAPKDGKRLHGLYSFSENFHGGNGDQLRECEYGNAWVRTAAGAWLPLQTAHFTHDETGKSARLDRCAGVRGNRFYLRHGDFTAAPADAVTRYRGELRVPEAGSPPSDTELPTPPGQEKNH